MGNCPNKKSKHVYRSRSPSPDLEPPQRPAPAPPCERTLSIEPPANPIVVCLYDFIPRGRTELQFQKGDKLEVLEKSGEDWWQARHLTTREQGFIPVPYIASISSLESQDWYFGEISREEAENLLKSHFNTIGAFLVRASDSDNYSHRHTVSVRVSENPREKQVRHYRILNVNGYFYISKHEVFQTLNDLVDAHLHKRVRETGLSTVLTHPCKRTAPTINDLTPDNQWEISPDSLQKIKIIGQGSFGEVWLGTWNYQVPVAIKTLKRGTMTREQFLEEATIMKKLRHKHILALHAVCSMDDPILIITEFMSNGSLLDFLKKNASDGYEIPLQSKIYLAEQVASGMKYLEANQLIHRDLAARNVLVGESLLCKVSDFGLARLIDTDEYNATSNLKFPVKWTAPEALIRNAFSTKSDVWSFGILLMETVTNGRPPYPGKNKKEVMEEVPLGYRMPKPAECPDELYELAYICWKREPNDRPAFSHIHDFLLNFDVFKERGYDLSDHIN